MLKIAESLIRKHKLYESFYIADMQVLGSKISEWYKELPTVQPFYAIKCNPDKQIISKMINERFGFDCASMKEINTVLNLGSHVDNIVFAHPVKKIEDIKYARTKNVKYTTFDSISELEKIRDHYPNVKCILRLKVDNPTARVQLGLKYGAATNEYVEIIDAAKDFGINIVGTSFHVGSASKDPQVFSKGLDYCREVFEYAKKKGYVMDVLDIGGGFTKETFKDCASVIRDNLDKNFDSTRVIAEPGRFFAEETFTFFTPVIGQRNRDKKKEYWISDGLYGSFNCILYDGQLPNYEVFRNPLLEEYTGSNEKIDSVIYGCSCDSADMLGNVNISNIRTNDFIMIKNFGAYTISAATDFNGINMTDIKMFYI